MLSLSLGLLLGTTVHALTCNPVQIYVSPSGTGDGSSANSAYGTVQQAATRVASIIQSSPGTQPVVNLASGRYYLSNYLQLTGQHSGASGCPVLWKGNNSTLSGGTKVTGWTTSNIAGVYKASVPLGSQTRALYVDGVAAPRARSVSMPQSSITITPSTFGYNGGAFQLSSISKPERAELRFVGTFTDRYMPVDFLRSDGSFVMEQPAWYRNLIGYDTISQHQGPGLFLGEQGFFVENSLSLLDQPGEWYLDEQDSLLYYKPINNKDPNTSDIVLPHLDVLVSIGGFNYQLPAHDIEFYNITFAHTTWNAPSTKYGFADQQTGAYIGEQFNRTNFEATRPFWYQTPGAVQVSVAQRVGFYGGAVTCTGAAGLAIGNDDNAMLSGVGYGAQNVTVSGMSFTQTGGNAVQVGGVQGNAHHPAMSQMINSAINIQRNTFTLNGQYFTSATNILMTYVQYSFVQHNTITETPYSALNLGWGWGSNDAKGNPQYSGRGLYSFQPLYTTPTTSQNNYVGYNLIRDVGLNHTDEGAIYHLGASPNTIVEKNAILNSHATGIYFDEGSRDLVARNNVIDARGGWFYENTQNSDSTLTGNNTFANNYVTQNNNLNVGSTPQGSVFSNNVYFSLSSVPQAAQAVINGAGA